MSEQPASPIAALLARILPGPIRGVRLGMPALPAGQEGALLPRFEERVWQLDADADDIPALPDEVVSGAAGGSLFIEALPSMKAARQWSAGEGLRGSAAFLSECLSRVPPGMEVAMLMSATALTSRKDSGLRRLLEEQHTVRWLVYLSNQLGIFPGLPGGFLVAIVVVTAGRVDERTRFVRLLDLRQCPPPEWAAELEQAKKRGGGEVGRSVVLRDRALGEEPWTYERFTSAFQASREDAAQLGQLHPLGELVDDITSGIHMTLHAKSVQPRGEEDAPPQGTISLLSGRDLQLDGSIGEASYWVALEAVQERVRVREGDVLIRSLANSGPRVVAVIAPKGIDAAFNHMVLRLRWRSSVPVHVRELLTAWLNSWRAGEALLAAGASMHISPSLLQNLEVPYPSDRVLEALGELARYEDWYHQRARQVREARQVIFEAERYGDAVGMLLDSHRAERERVTAAESSQRFDYRVRNSYLYPIALRREQILRLEDGKERIEAVIECAEHLLHYLAVLSIVQLASFPGATPVPKSLTGKARLSFDWGSSYSMLKQAVDATAKHQDPLALPFPQLAQLAEKHPQAAAFYAAEQRLRAWRNAHSHLRRQPRPEMVETSREFARALDDILGAVAFLTDLPLVRVCDYRLDEVDESRKAVFEYIRGASSVFEVSTQAVDRELPRGRLGVLPRDGAFVSLAPWLVCRPCAICKQPEIFIFNHLDARSVTFVAMESGHALEDETLAAGFHKLVADSKT